MIGFFSLIVAKHSLPEFLRYGKTLMLSPKSKKNTYPSEIWYMIKNFTVPKSWFSHFYTLSVIESAITVYYFPSYPLSWILLAHGARRLYETLFIMNYNGKHSRMNWSHYLVGLWFYSSLHVITFIKLRSKQIDQHLHLCAVLLYLCASWDQYKNHQELSRLPKYSLPAGRLFRWIACPHYLDETLIYTSFLSYHTEFIWPLAWVMASLGVSAVETKKFCQQTFKSSARYAMIPGFL